MQNLLTKQEPDGAYDTDLYDLQKRIVTETTIWLGQIGKPHFPKKHILWDISIYQIKCLRGPVIYHSSIFIPLGHKIFVYNLNSCVLLIEKQNESC